MILLTLLRGNHSLMIAGYEHMLRYKHYVFEKCLSLSPITVSLIWD